MTSRERIQAAWDGKTADHVPLTTWCFGLPAPASLRWSRGGREVRYWYSLRMEHIHTLPFPWELEDELTRAEAWASIGVDDIIDVSVPWSVDPSVTWTEARREASGGEQYPVLTREYRTPKGVLRHAVRKTGEGQGEGWVVQPDAVPLIEDFNIPRAERHAVSEPGDVEKLAFLYRPPDAAARAWFAGRMQRVRESPVADRVPVQAWAGFGMDAVVWFCGTQGAIMLALDHPKEFGALFDIITEADLGRTELAAAHPGVDMVVERGWYSSTNFWSPALFDAYVLPHVTRLVSSAHAHGKKFAYVMTTGTEVLGPRLAEAGVDVLYFVDPLDPIQKGLSLEKVRDMLSGSMTLVGGISSITLSGRDYPRIDRDVARALDVLGPTNRFILHPVDAVFPDTPWESMEKLIEAWVRYR
jgi:hypothetical protein